MKGKLYGTLGPGCADMEILRRMLRAGMSGMRLNLSHGTLLEAADIVRLFHAAAEAEGVQADLLLDLQGPELRIGALDIPVELCEGECVVLGKDFSVPDVLWGNLHEGDELLLDDGAFLLRVEEETSLRCRVLRGGLLRSHKSLAVVGRELPTPVLTEQDKENLRIAKEYGATALMQPFVRGKEDILAVRAAVRECGAEDIQIFAKIENLTGLHKVEEIADVADVVVCARGDLGNAMPLWELPRAQARITRVCKEKGRPFMISTQMLHSMHESAVPTRAEVTDVYTAAKSGAGYLLLTGETAVGQYPAEAMEYFARIAENGWEDAES